MNKERAKLNKKYRKKIKIRAKISGTAEVPRLNVFKSNRGEYVQLIDDVRGETIVGIASKKVEVKGAKVEKSMALGKAVAKVAMEKGIKRIVFDRGGNKYHGRVKAVAEGARETGIEF